MDAKAAVSRRNLAELLLVKRDLVVLLPVLQSIEDHQPGAHDVLEGLYIRLFSRGRYHLRRLVACRLSAENVPLLTLEGVDLKIDGNNISSTNPFLEGEDAAYAAAGRAELLALQHSLASGGGLPHGGGTPGLDLTAAAGAAWRKKVALGWAAQLEELVQKLGMSKLLADMKDPQSLADQAAFLERVPTGLPPAAPGAALAAQVQEQQPQQVPDQSPGPGVQQQQQWQQEQQVQEQHSLLPVRPVARGVQQQQQREREQHPQLPVQPMTPGVQPHQQHSVASSGAQRENFEFPPHLQQLAQQPVQPLPKAHWQHPPHQLRQQAAPSGAQFTAGKVEADLPPHLQAAEAAPSLLPHPQQQPAEQADVAGMQAQGLEHTCYTWELPPHLQGTATAQQPVQQQVPPTFPSDLMQQQQRRQQGAAHLASDLGMRQQQQNQPSMAYQQSAQLPAQLPPHLQHQFGMPQQQAQQAQQAQCPALDWGSLQQAVALVGAGQHAHAPSQKQQEQQQQQQWQPGQRQGQGPHAEPLHLQQRQAPAQQAALIQPQNQQPQVAQQQSLPQRQARPEQHQPLAQQQGAAEVQQQAAAQEGSPPAEEFSMLVANLGNAMTEDELKIYFRVRYPSVTSTLVPLISKSQQPKGFGFVRFSCEKEFNRAMKDMDGHVLPGGNCIGTGVGGKRGGQAAAAAQAAPQAASDDATPAGGLAASQAASVVLPPASAPAESRAPAREEVRLAGTAGIARQSGRAKRSRECSPAEERGAAGPPMAATGGKRAAGELGSGQPEQQPALHLAAAAAPPPSGMAAPLRPPAAAAAAGAGAAGAGARVVPHMPNMAVAGMQYPLLGAFGQPGMPGMLPGMLPMMAWPAAAAAAGEAQQRLMRSFSGGMQQMLPQIWPPGAFLRPLGSIGSMGWQATGGMPPHIPPYQPSPPAQTPPPHMQPPPPAHSPPAHLRNSGTSSREHFLPNAALSKLGSGIDEPAAPLPPPPSAAQCGSGAGESAVRSRTRSRSRSPGGRRRIRERDRSGSPRGVGSGGPGGSRHAEGRRHTRSRSPRSRPRQRSHSRSPRHTRLVRVPATRLTPPAPALAGGGRAGPSSTLPLWLPPMLKTACTSCAFSRGLPFQAASLLGVLDELRGQRDCLHGTGLSLRLLCEFLSLNCWAEWERRNDVLWIVKVHASPRAELPRRRY